MEPKALSDRELLWLLIGRDTTEVLYRGRLSPLVLGEGDVTAHPLLASALEITRRVLRENLCDRQCLTSSEMTREYLVAHFAGKPYEVFVCLYLDNQHRVITVEDMFRGTIDGTAVYPREVVRRALTHNAAACIFAHNHPSGVAEPSMADQSITSRLKQALSVIDVRVLDHIVVGGSDVVSFAERGLM